MIPPYDETIRLIEKNLPGWMWLLRNDPDGDKGKYFFHLNVGFDGRRSFDYTFPVWAETPNQAAFEAYCAACAVVGIPN